MRSMSCHRSSRCCSTLLSIALLEQNLINPKWCTQYINPRPDAPPMSPVPSSPLPCECCQPFMFLNTAACVSPCCLHQTDSSHSSAGLPTSPPLTHTHNTKLTRVPAAWPPPDNGSSTGGGSTTGGTGLSVRSISKAAAFITSKAGIASLVVLALVLLVGATWCCICCRRRRQFRLSKALEDLAWGGQRSGSRNKRRRRRRKQRAKKGGGVGSSEESSTFEGGSSSSSDDAEQARRKEGKGKGKGKKKGGGGKSKASTDPSVPLPQPSPPLGPRCVQHWSRGPCV